MRLGGLLILIKVKIMKKIITFILALVVAAPAFAGEMEINNVWARATAPSATAGAVYLEILNMTGEHDAIVAATTTAARKVELHYTRLHDNGMMTMERQEMIDLPRKIEVVMAPGGLHIMLMGLNEQLREGEEFPIQLQFKKHKPLNLTVKVQNIKHRPAYDARGDMSHDMGEMKGMKH